MLVIKELVVNDFIKLWVLKLMFDRLGTPSTSNLMSELATETMGAQ